MRRDPGLDGLRALAALAVLFAHGGYFLFAALPHYDLYALTSWLGTEVFFALGGFLVAASLLERRVERFGAALQYTAWRLWRLLPMYWLFIGVHGLLTLAAGRALPDALAAYASGAQNLAWPHPQFFAEAWNLPIFLLLSLVLPGLVLGAMAQRRPLRWIGAGLTLLLVLAISLRAVWVIELQPSWDEGVRKIVIARLDACLYGALAAVVLAGGIQVRRIHAATFAFGALALALVLFLALPRDSSLNARICAFLAAGLGCAGLVLALRGLTFPAQRALDALSHWSYALYLVNMPMLFALTLVGIGPGTNAPEALLHFVLWLVLTVLVAAGVHRWIERPLLARFPRADSRLAQHPRPVAKR
jgi:peptidoglycan/LPS O-acetylase OafA/YrhL